MLGAALLLAAALSEASPVRVTTWDLEPTLMAGSNGWSASYQKTMVREVAATLGKLHPDVIILQNVAGWDICHELAAQLQPVYPVGVCSTFRDPHSKRLGHQVAVLSRTKAFLGWAESWQNTGDFSGQGYGVAVLRLGDKNAAVFSVQARQEWGSNIVKQISTFQNWSDNRPQAFIVAGDFDSPDLALERIGFDKASVPSGCVFTRDAGQVAVPTITRTALCEHPAATFEMDLDALVNRRAILATPPATSKSLRNILWLAAGVGGILLALGLAGRSKRRGRQTGLAIASPRAGQVLGAPAEGLPYVHIETEGLMQTQSQTWHVPPETVRARPKLTAEAEASVVASVSRWLKHAVLRRLLSDRSQLAATQQVAAMKVLEVDKRLAKVERQIQQQQRDYEECIDGLLKELVAAKEENRELIRAKIALVKAEMEKAQHRARAGF